MKRAATVLRHYHEADATMRQDMRTMHAHYLTHQAVFAVFNPEFGAAFGPDWLTAIDTADTTSIGAVRVAELKENTAQVQDTMGLAQAAIQTLFYYGGRAYPHNASRLDQYGRRLYEAARNNHDKMRTLLETAFKAATRDKTTLATKGYTPAQLAGLNTLALQLNETNTTQEVKKGSNTEDGDHYLTIQNLAYGYGQEVSAAAKIIFADNAATLKLFRLSGPAAPAHETHELTVGLEDSGTVLFTTPFTATTQLHLRLAVPQPGQEAVVGRVVAPGNKIFTFVTLTQDASEMEVTAAALGPAGQYVLVQNGSSKPVRVEITVLG